MIHLPCPSCGRSFALRLDAPAPFSCPNCSAISHLSLSSLDTATLPPGAGQSPDSTLRGGDAVPASLSGTLLGYEILGELGRGGMGVVYKARHKVLHREVALKMILAGVHAGSDEVMRFRTEAEAIARLQHPGIVQVFEIGEHDGKPFFALEFCAGGSLEKKLAGTPMQPEEAASLVEKLSRAMHAAHECKVIHRDLKPANVLLGADGTPKITDFGLAKKMDEQGQTQTGSVMGTPSYMAPEQAEGKKNIGPAADVYALGAILYECLTGRPPFRAATAIDTIMQVLTTEPAAPSQLNPQVPKDLETICLKCLQKDPLHRYRSAAELGDDLRRYLNGESIQARSLGMFGILIQSLERSHYDREFRTYSTVLFWFAGIVAFCYSVKHFLLINRLPHWQILLFSDNIMLVMMLAVLWWYRREGKGMLPTSPAERLLWSVWSVYIIVCLLDGVVMVALFPMEQVYEGYIYPFICLHTGMAFWILGSSYWGRLYLVAFAFFALAMLLLLDQYWGTLAFGGLWSATLVMIGLRLRHLGQSAAGGETSK